MNVHKLLLLLLIQLAPCADASETSTETMAVNGGTLLLEWRTDFSKEQKQTIRSWLQSATDTVRLLNGELPRSPIRLALKAYPGKAAVPFARVLRDDPQGVLFYISPDRTTEEYIDDWTAYHELSHLFIPYPGRAYIWFSEGLATYYQNILQFRAGLLTAEETRQKFSEGFSRGTNDNRNSDLNLKELSLTMRENHAFMRIYWTGTLYFLEADLALRQLPEDQDLPRTMDDLLRAFGECCLADNRRWTGESLAREFDRLAGSDVFVPLYQRYVLSTAVPAYTELLNSPGLDAILTGSRK